MTAASSNPPPTADERSALDQLDQIEAVVRSAPTQHVLWRAKVLLDRLVRYREIEQARCEFGEIVEGVHERIRQSGEPEITDEEIQAEVDAVRAQRAGQSRKP